MKKLGFGCMRLPMAETTGEVDLAEFNKMIDRYMEEGFNYFDTAHGYLDGKSETAIRECLVKRYPRDSFILVDKLSSSYFEKEEDIVPFFENQLKWCGTEYFDYYLMHALNAEYYEKYQNCNCFERAMELKGQGKIRHLGISFHDKADLLEKILMEHPEIEVVQIQFNYADYEDPGIESRKCYEVCKKYDKPVIIMEPVKGGGLVNLPQEAKELLDANGNGASYASYAIRFCASFEQVMMVLSGMSDLPQMEDNISYMKEFIPFRMEEYALVEKVTQVLKSKNSIPCTACQYCVAGCPKEIPIPDLFADYNAKVVFNDWNSNWYYEVHTKQKGKASDCISCKKCESICPQHLAITSYLTTVKETFETA